MMETIIEPTMDYDLSKLYFGPPSTLAGGAYFTRILHGTNKPLFVQTPKSLTKQGFVKSGKKMYVDLMFDNNDTIFINWIENLETRCQELLYLKSDSWFETKLEKDDIESAFTSPIKIFKSGKNYLLRVNVKPNIKIYDENNNVVSTDTITSEVNLISIIEIQGIKFTSRNFQIEIELKQSMIVSPDPFLDKCFIKTPIRKPKKEEFHNTEKEETIDLDELISKSVEELKSKKEEIDETEINTKLNSVQSINSLQSIQPNVKLNIEPIDIEPSIERSIERSIEPSIERSSVNVKDDSNIVLEVEDLNAKEDLEDPHVLKEFNLTSDINDLETITLKKPNQVYYEIYQKAREKAKELKKNAILAYLEMKNIKKTYMLDDIDESDSDFDNFDSDEESESLEEDN